jgi:hypothetical protein
MIQLLQNNRRPSQVTYLTFLACRLGRKMKEDGRKDLVFELAGKCSRIGWQDLSDHLIQIAQGDLELSTVMAYDIQTTP